MKQIVLLVLAITFMSAFALIPNLPGTAYPTEEPTSEEYTVPEYIWSECGGVRPHVSIGWYLPPASAIPFEESHPGMAGYLYVHGKNYWKSYFLNYLGPQETPYGIMYRWYAPYDMPNQPYSLTSVVIGSGGTIEYQVVPGNFDPKCYVWETMIYFPIVARQE